MRQGTIQTFSKSHQRHGPRTGPPDSPVVGTGCARMVGQGQVTDRGQKSLCVLKERKEARTCSSRAVHALDPALAAGLCLKGTHRFRGKTHPTKITQVPGGSGANAPTQALLVTSEALACRMAIPPFSFRKLPLLHFWSLQLRPDKAASTSEVST